jgi:hypothetical protein
LVEHKLMKNSDKVELTGGGETNLHSHAGGGGSVPTEYSESEGDTSSNSTSWQNKLTHTIQTAGVYFVQWYFEIRGTSTQYHVRSQVQHNSSEIGNVQFEPEDISPDYWLSGGGIKKLTLSQDDTIKINYCSENSSTTTHIRFARIALIKIG